MFLSKFWLREMTVSSDTVGLSALNRIQQASGLLKTITWLTRRQSNIGRKAKNRILQNPLYREHSLLITFLTLGSSRKGREARYAAFFTPSVMHYFQQ